MKLLYFIWALLPLCLFWLCFWAKLKDWTGTFGKEYVADYISSAWFALIALGIAILFEIYVFPQLVIMTSFNEDEAWVTSFLIYPVILLIMATISGKLNPDKTKQKSRVQHKGF